MGTLKKDLLHAIRKARLNPGFSCAVVLMLAVAVGINGAMFAIVSAVLLRALPFAAPGTLVTIGRVSPRNPTFDPLVLSEAQSIAAHSSGLQNAAYWAFVVEAMDHRGMLHQTFRAACNSKFFLTMGVRPILGRTFSVDDERHGADQVAVLSSRLWHQVFDADPSVLGKAVGIGSRTFTVIGIMPDSFVFPLTSPQPLVWTPLESRPEWNSDSIAVFQMVGRRWPAVTDAQLKAELVGIGMQNKNQANNSQLALESYREQLIKDVRRPLFAMQLSMLVVWFVACVNIATLALLRTVARRRELTIQLSLGAGRAMLLRQFLAEYAVLAIVAFLAAIPLAIGTIEVVRAFVDAHLPFSHEIHVRPDVMAAQLVLCIVSAMLVGSVSAWHATRASPREILADTSPAASGRHGAILNALVGSQIAITFLLLTSADFAVRNLTYLRRADIGFAPANLISVPLVRPADRYRQVDLASSLYDPLLQAIQHLPGVTSVGLSSTLPLNPNVTFTMPVRIAGSPRKPSAQDFALLRAVNPEFHGTLGISLQMGRLFSPRDSATTPWVVIVNQAFVRRYLAELPTLGNRLRLGKKGDPHEFATIVGIMHDTPQRSIKEPSLPEVNIPYRQVVSDDDLGPVLLGTYVQIAVRSSSPPNLLVPAIRSAVRPFNPEWAKAEIETFQTMVDRSLVNDAMLSRLLAILGAVAVLLAVYGVYALAADTGRRRQRELAIRTALGASSGVLVRLLLVRHLRVIACGLGAGVLGAGLAGRVIRSFFYAARPQDAWPTVAPALAFAICAAAIVIAPSWHAATANVADSLRRD
jgi:putative ABC transport system permease protein